MVLECLNRNRAGVRENPRLSCRSYTVEPLAVGKVLRDASNVQISFIPMETFFHQSIDSTHKVYGTGQIFGWRKFLEISSYKILRSFARFFVLARYYKIRTIFKSLYFNRIVVLFTQVFEIIN